MHWYCCTYSLTFGSEYPLRHLSNQIFNLRSKRDGGTIPFRPLFVYRQQQKEKQARWKLLEAQKLLKQEQLNRQSETSNQQNYVSSHSELSLKPLKLNYSYREVPAYSIYQTTAHQRNPTYQQYFQNYPVNTFETYPTYNYYTNFEQLYDNQDDGYYDKYNSGYYS